MCIRDRDEAFTFACDAELIYKQGIQKDSVIAVSYTHLDVYKRQEEEFLYIERTVLTLRL